MIHVNKDINGKILPQTCDKCKVVAASTVHLTFVYPKYRNTPPRYVIRALCPRCANTFLTCTSCATYPFCRTVLGSQKVCERFIQGRFYEEQELNQ